MCNYNPRSSLPCLEEVHSHNVFSTTEINPELTKYKSQNILSISNKLLEIAPVCKQMQMFGLGSKTVFSIVCLNMQMFYFN